MIKKAATISAPTQEVTELGGGKWRLVTATTLKSMTTEFEFDKPFDEKGSAPVSILQISYFAALKWSHI